jgi:hypothetical protein
MEHTYEQNKMLKEKEQWNKLNRGQLPD